MPDTTETLAPVGTQAARIAGLEARERAGIRETAELRGSVTMLETRLESARTRGAAELHEIRQSLAAMEQERRFPRWLTATLLLGVMAAMLIAFAAVGIARGVLPW